MHLTDAFAGPPGGRWALITLATIAAMTPLFFWREDFRAAAASAPA